jgi:glycosyltransferase involved in cell wall biosynthesis
MTLDTSPTVSVVIPVYNGERYLAEAITSVLDQTYKSFELIVVDDGSTDKSAAVVRSFTDDRIRYLYQSNGGASKARNLGVAASRGTVIAFLDSDDAWLPRKLERQVDYLASYKEVGAVYCWYEVLEPNGSRRACSLSVGHDPWEIIKTGCGLLPSATTFRKEVLQKVGGFDEAFLGSEYQDLELSLRLSEITRFACLPEILLLYRHPETIGAHPGKHSLGHLLNRGIYLNKYLSRYQGDERICKHIYHLMVGYWSDLGKLKLAQGQVAEGRQALVNALRLSLEQRTNAKMFVRTLRRLIRNYF